MNRPWGSSPPLTAFGQSLINTLFHMTRREPATRVKRFPLLRVSQSLSKFPWQSRKNFSIWEPRAYDEINYKRLHKKVLVLEQVTL